MGSVIIKIPKDNEIEYKGFSIRKTSKGNYRVNFAYDNVFNSFTAKSEQEAKQKIDHLKKNEKKIEESNMKIENKIEEYLNRKSKLIKEQNEFEGGDEPYDISDDVFDLLNGLDDEYLSEDQLALKSKILNSLAPEIPEDFDEEEFDMEPESPEIMSDEEENQMDEPEDFPFDNSRDVDVPENMGDDDLYGYDEDDITLADSMKVPFKVKKRLLVKENLSRSKK